MDRSKLIQLGGILTPQRLHILDLLKQHPGIGVTGLSREAGRGVAGTYRHLEKLRAAGVVHQKFEDDGRRGIPVIDVEALRELVQLAVEWTKTLE